jgi:hypothetical protein
MIKQDNNENAKRKIEERKMIPLTKDSIRLPLDCNQNK